MRRFKNFCFMHMSLYLHESLCTSSELGSRRGQKGELHFLELELLMGVSHHLGIEPDPLEE